MGENNQMIAKEKIREDLNHILNEVAKTQNITNFEINPSTEANYGDGFVAQFYTGSIQNKDTGETIGVAIKKAPTWDFDYKAIFKNEDLFYSEIFPALDDLQKETSVCSPFNSIPKYFCGGMEPKKEYIAMENLKPLGYVMFDKKQYLDKVHLEKIFKTYGKFHALSYILRNKDLEKYHAISKDLSDLTKTLVEFMHKPMTAAISAAVNSLDTENDKIMREEIGDLGENAMETFLKASTYNGIHKCLVHGDCWSNNMLFKYSESGELLDIKLIDFQLCQENSPIHDLSYFFYSGASKRDFDELDNYLKIYHQSFSDFAKELGAGLDEIFSLETLKQEWKENALFGVFFGIYLWQVKLIPKEDFAPVLNDDTPERPSMEESMKLWEVLLDTVHKTDSYKERTTAILRHAFEYGVLNRNKIVRKKL